jgi:hypothetical protein
MMLVRALRLVRKGKKLIRPSQTSQSNRSRFRVRASLRVSAESTSAFTMASVAHALSQRQEIMLPRRIRSLQDFRDNFGTVMQIFRDNNLAEEYARRFEADPGYFEGWRGPLARHSTPEIERLFHGLLRWINREGVDGVRARIEPLFVATHQNAEALYLALRALMYNPACTACTRPHTAPPRRPFPFDVFISNARDKDDKGRDNQVLAKRLNAGLKRLGMKTWFDDDQRQGEILDCMTRASSVQLLF